jgi:ankyrin repeat protein
MVAAAMGRLDVVKVLLEIEEVECNCKNRDGMTALHLAVRARCGVAVKALAECSRTDKGIRDKRGMMACDYARLDQLEDVMEMVKIDRRRGATM